MFSFRIILLLFLFALIAILGSTSGEQECDDLSAARTEMSDEQTRQSLDNADKFGRITLDCGSTGGGSGGSNGLSTIIDLSVGLFFVIWVAIGIWIVFVRRQKAMNAAVVKPYPGEEMGYGMGEKTKTVAMSAPAGKLSNGDTNV
ncbi:PREDICTED: uncharacterized protein LOC104765763 [Camelina sativa]|uniref:Uncharacterized protein LOC104765763 n=1 Tax=Camelina sativa TaxID=90675 RepID=A0ABM0XLT3_CAMSA|nr:PREDICTED: uncharacterized protein LOC104765763 [Camelina sativa]